MNALCILIVGVFLAFPAQGEREIERQAVPKDPDQIKKYYKEIASAIVERAGRGKLPQKVKGRLVNAAEKLLSNGYQPADFVSDIHSIVANEKDANCKVTFTTKDGENMIKNGYTIKYKFTKDNTVMTSKDTSTCEETLVIGTYEIWAEKGGKTASEKRTYTVVEEKEKISIILN